MKKNIFINKKWRHNKHNFTTLARVSIYISILWSRNPDIQPQLTTQIWRTSNFIYRIAKAITVKALCLANTGFKMRHPPFTKKKVETSSGLGHGTLGTMNHETLFLLFMATNENSLQKYTFHSLKGQPADSSLIRLLDWSSALGTFGF